MSKELKSWQVEYSATYWVKAESEDEAIELAIEEHSKGPDGSWEAELEAWPPVEVEEAGA
jgi:hypothetical protein